MPRCFIADDAIVSLCLSAPVAEKGDFVAFRAALLPFSATIASATLATKSPFSEKGVDRT